jgi:hypothetical protein
MLFRPGTSLRVWNAHDVDTLVVDDEQEEREALSQGWKRHPAPDPLDHDGDGRKGGSLPGVKRKGPRNDRNPS